MLIRRNAAENFFLQGLEADRDGDTLLALQSFAQAWKLDTASEFLTQFTSEYALRAGEPGQAIFIISGGAKPDALNDEKLRYMGMIYLRYQRYADALDVYRELDTLDKKDSLILSNLMAENKLYKEAAAMLDQVADENDSLQQIKVADLYRRSGDGEKAIERFRTLLDKYPTDRAVKKGLGLSLLAYGDEKEAMDLLIWFLPVSGGIPDPQVVELVGRYYASQSRYSDAVQLFQFLYKNDGSQRDFYYGRPLAVYSFLDGRLQYARNLMVQLLKTNGDDYELHFLLGSVLESMGDFEGALDSYGAALEINPLFEDAMRAQVLVFARQNSMEEAIPAAISYTQNKPESIDAWALYGSLLTMKRMFEDAIIPLNRAVELSGEKPAISVLFELGMSLERTGRVKEAVKVFKDILKREPTHAPTANYLGYMWAENDKKLDKAEELILTALEVDPDNGAYLDSYGWVLYRKGEYESALVALEKALELINDDYVIYYHLGCVLEKLGRHDEALERFIEANSFENPQKEEIQRKIDRLSLLLEQSETTVSELSL